MPKRHVPKGPSVAHPQRLEPREFAQLNRPLTRPQANDPRGSGVGWAVLVLLIVGFWPLARNAGRKELNTSQEYTNKAQNYHQLGEFQAAAALYDRAAQMDPTNRFLLINRANAIEMLADPDRLCGAFRDMLRVNPDDDQTTAKLALATRTTGDYASSIHLFEQLLNKQPLNYANLFVRRNYASALLLSGQHEAALDVFDSALRISPHDKEGLLGRGESLFAMGLYDKAIKAYDEALARDSLFIDAHWKRGLALYQRGGVNGAVKAMEKVLRLNPSYEPAVLHKAYHLFAKGPWRATMYPYLDTAATIHHRWFGDQKPVGGLAVIALVAVALAWWCICSTPTDQMIIAKMQSK